MTYTGRFAAMTSSAIHHTTLLRHCFEWPRHCSNIPTLYWAKIVVANRLVCNMTLIEFSISNARGMVACLLGVPSFKAKRRKRGRRTKAFWARGWGEGGGKEGGGEVAFFLEYLVHPSSLLRRPTAWRWLHRKPSESTVVTCAQWDAWTLIRKNETIIILTSGFPNDQLLFRLRTALEASWRSHR